MWRDLWPEQTLPLEDSLEGWKSLEKGRTETGRYTKAMSVPKLFKNGFDPDAHPAACENPAVSVVFVVGHLIILKEADSALSLPNRKGRVEGSETINTTCQTPA